MDSLVQQSADRADESCLYRMQGMMNEYPYYMISTEEQYSVLHGLMQVNSRLLLEHAMSVFR